VFYRQQVLLTVKHSVGLSGWMSRMADELSTSQSAVTLFNWGVKAGMVHSTCGEVLYI